MVAGHLQEKKGYYYVVLNYSVASGKRKTKWISTNLPIKGNKKRAEQILMEERLSFVPEEPEKSLDDIGEEDIFFSDFLIKWLEIAKTTIAITTYASYSNMTKNIISPYFEKRQITLKKLKASDIQDFYIEELKRVKAATVIHYHAIIHRALKYAVKIDIIDSNPADKIERPKQEKFVGNFYSPEEIKQLFKAAKGTKLEAPIVFGAFYGLRRSEAIGVKWSNIDFENNIISVSHKVTGVNLDGKYTVIAQDSMKNRSSCRAMPLVPAVKELLLEIKSQQEENRKLCGRCYNKEYLDYVCVDEMGNRLLPNYVSDGFSALLKNNGLRHIRFHDLRHSCASLLVAKGEPMKQIQEWLGHSDFSTTANIYAHLDYSSKIASADTMMSELGEALAVFG
ncbi:MAG: site-specific integrase [Oscillospiraceae bacterium]|nr:site-specific integrase [Oscillospiraceae bacterium]